MSWFTLERGGITLRGRDKAPGCRSFSSMG